MLDMDTTDQRTFRAHGYGPGDGADDGEVGELRDSFREAWADGDKMTETSDWVYVEELIGLKACDKVAAFFAGADVPDVSFSPEPWQTAQDPEAQRRKRAEMATWVDIIEDLR